jgi:hypothetical protein
MRSNALLDAADVSRQRRPDACRRVALTHLVRLDVACARSRRLSGYERENIRRTVRGEHLTFDRAT